MTPSRPAYQRRQRKRSPSNQYNSARAVSVMSRLRMAPHPHTEGPLSRLRMAPHPHTEGPLSRLRMAEHPHTEGPLSRLRMAEHPHPEGPLSRLRMAPHPHTEGPLSRLELLRSEYQERALREKEDKMLKLLTQQQQGHRGPPQERAWASNWTPAKRTSGVDRAHPLQPIRAHHPLQPVRHPSSAHITPAKHPLPYVRSKSGPGRPDQWQELEKSEKNLEAEIRRKETLLREKLRRTEEELRRIQREREEAEREERRAREIQDRRTRPEDGGQYRGGGVKAQKDSPLSIDQYSGGGVKTRKDSPLPIDQYRGGGVKAREDSPLYIDQYRGGGVKTQKGSPLPIDQYSRGGVKASPLPIDQYRGGGVKTQKDSPLSIDQYSGGGVKSQKDSHLYIDQYCGGGVKSQKDSPLYIDQYSGGGVKAMKDSPLSSDLASPSRQRPPLSHVEDSFHQLRLDIQGGQDSGRPSSETLDEVNDPQSPGQPPVPCPLCGRCFMEHRLQKHSAVCEKMHSSRRKVFDSSKARAKGTDLEQYLHKKGRRPSPPPQVGVSSWRQKHESFLRTIRHARVVQDVVARGGKLSDLPPPPPEENPDYVACPHCNRRFAPRAAERHIPKCETIKSKPRPPPARRR